MVFGYAYPAYDCFKIVEKNNPEIGQLLSWILVSPLTVSERIEHVFLSWLPLHSETKLALFIYLWSSKIKGTEYMYSCFLKPFMAGHEAEIDRNIWELRTKAGNFAILYWKKARSIGKARFLEIFKSVPSTESAITTQPLYPEQGNKSIVSSHIEEASGELACDTEWEPILEEPVTYMENEEIIDDNEAVHMIRGKWRRMFSSAANPSKFPIMGYSPLVKN